MARLHAAKTERPDGDDHARHIQHATAAQSIAGQSWTGGLAATPQRWWAAFLTWRSEQAAIAELAGMSDRELHDIGVCRCGIEQVVMEKSTRGGAVHRATTARSSPQGARP